MVHPSTSRHAFSLVELSIVLVILGLLVGGILSGRSLIHAAELRSFYTQQANYSAAVRSFRDKYLALPGDMPNATQFWGLQLAGVNCAITSSTDTKTCDGDGDGWVANSVNSFESARLWQQLVNAGLIEGSYDGVNDKPQSKVGSGRIYIEYWGIVTVTRQPQGDYGNIYYSDATLVPEDMWNIDTKLDDGKPMTGKVVIFDLGGNFPAGGCTDATSATDYTASYKLTSTALTCWPFIRKQY